MSFEPIEPVHPALPVRLQPRIDFFERLRAEPVDPTLGVRPDVDQPGFPEHPEMLRDRRLAHPEPVDQLPYRAVAIEEEIQDAAPVGFGQEFEGGDHGLSMPDGLYACQDISQPLRRSSSRFAIWSALVEP